MDFQRALILANDEGDGDQLHSECREAYEFLDSHQAEGIKLMQGLAFYYGYCIKSFK